MLNLAVRVKPLVHHYHNMATYFSAPRLKSAFTFQDLYVGLSPFDAPATFSMLSYSELAHGVWYPRGGMYSVVEALVELARAAVWTSLRHGRHRDHHQREPCHRRDACRRLAPGGRRGVGECRPAVRVPAPPAPRPDGEVAPAKAFSCSAISFLWGVDRPYEALEPAHAFLADDYRENFHAIITGPQLAG